MDSNKLITFQEEQQLYTDVCAIISEARRHVATYVNEEACLMNWRVGKRIKEDILLNKRAEYGKQVLINLAKRLTEQFGTGWGHEKLKQCVRSAYLFSEEEIRYAARTQLTWTHLRSIMSISNELERKFYMEMCRVEQYFTQLPDQKLLADKLQRAIAIAREKQQENKPQ